MIDECSGPFGITCRGLMARFDYDLHSRPKVLPLPSGIRAK
jgi:hypothetical protein